MAVHVLRLTTQQREALLHVITSVMPPSPLEMREYRDARTGTTINAAELLGLAMNAPIEDEPPAAGTLVVTCPWCEWTVRQQYEHDRSEVREAVYRARFLHVRERHPEVMGDIPELYDLAKQVTHEVGASWTDPRTGVTYPPPVVVKVIDVQEALDAAHSDGQDLLKPDDHLRLRDIEQEHDPILLAGLIRAYHRDADRANRTPRSFLYLHLGMLAGALERLIEKP